MKPGVLTTLSLLALALAFSGCGKSKEQAALEHVAQIKKPGWVRVVNLTDKKQTTVLNDRVLSSDLAAMGSTFFLVVPSGDQKLHFKTDDTDGVELPVKVEPNGIYNVVLFPDNKATLIDDAQIHPDSTQNFSSYFIDSSGKPFPGKVTISNGTDSFDIDQSSGGMKIPNGEYTVKGDGLDVAKGVTVADDSAYTLLVMKTDAGKKIGMLLRNASDRKPSMGGAG